MELNTVNTALLLEPAADLWSGRARIAPNAAAQGTALSYAGFPMTADDRQAAPAAATVATVAVQALTPAAKHQVPPPREHR